ncbi:MAG: hypothetical protein GXO89_01830 [Chlorobi bacterium]|nr:hypothetical protein [Chlorobiota bacterium]
MKSFTKTVAIIIFFIGVLVYSNPTLGQIHSTASGGNWSNSSTWVGGIAPGILDDVVINGPVYIETGNGCNNITIANTGSLQNKNGGNRTLAVNGNISNQGTIQNNNYFFYLDIHGDIDNNGSWSNYNTFLVGASDQNISSTTSFSGYSFRSLKTTGDIFANSTLRFNNTIVDFNGDTLQMNTGNDSIILNNGRLIETTILSSGGAPGQVYFNFSNTAYVDEVYIEANEVVMDGVFQFVDIFQVIGNVRVEGTLQNLNGGHYTVTINGNLTNNGTIRDNNYNCYLYITGDIYQNGTWTNNHTYLSGDADQNLWFTQPFSPSLLRAKT